MVNCPSTPCCCSLLDTAQAAVSLRSVAMSGIRRPEGVGNRRIAEMATLKAEVATWERDRNNRSKGVDWQFTTADARVKLKHLYPKL